MKHPIPQTPDEMQREALGAIIRACRDIERCAEQMDVAGVKTHFGFLKTTIGRLDVIMTTVQQKPRELGDEGLGIREEGLERTILGRKA